MADLKTSQEEPLTELSGNELVRVSVPSSDGYESASAPASLFLTGLQGLTFVSDTGSTADSDPGAGLFKWNNATQGSATVLYFDNSTLDSISLTTFWASLASTGMLRLQQANNATQWQEWKWTALPVDGTGYRKFTVTIQAKSVAAIDDGVTVYCDFKNDASGSSGGGLQGLTFTSDTGSTADSDPGAGLFKWNNATQPSATVLYFNNATADGVTATTFFASFGQTGFLCIQQSDDATKWQLWKVTVVVAGSGYYKFTATIQANSTAAIDDNKLIYCSFQASGTSSGSTIGKHAIPILAGSMLPSATGGCAPLARIASAANQPDIVTLDFDQTAQEYAQFWIPMPKSWNEGTVTFKAYWSHPATTTNFGVVWDLQAIALSDDDAIAQAYGTAQTSTDTGGTTNDLYISPESSAITIAGTPAAEDMVLFRLSRVTANGSDTMAVDARLHGIVLFITTDAENDA